MKRYRKGALDKPVPLGGLLTVTSVPVRVGPHADRSDTGDIDGDGRSRRRGIVPALLMALVVGRPTATIAGWSLWNPALLEQPRRWPDLAVWAAGPTVLLGLLVVPSLLLGRWPSRLTAVRSWVWLLLAALLFVLPGIGLATLEIVERPSATGDPDRPATISTWVVGNPDTGTVAASIIGAGLIVVPGWMAGNWARAKNPYAAITAAIGMTTLGIIALAIWFVLHFANSLSAHAVFTPEASLLSVVPVVTWLAAPSVAVLAGAEQWAEDDR